MGNVLIELVARPGSPDTNMDKMALDIKAVIRKVTGNDCGIKKEPFVFGMTQLIITVAIDPDKVKGGTDPIEKAISGVKGVQSVEVNRVTLV